MLYTGQEGVHQRPPSAAVFMARSLLPSPGLSPDGAFPPLSERWEGFRVAPAQLEALLRGTGLAANAGAVLYPHVFGFRLQMALLTRRAFPLPIWRALQAKNHLAQLTSFDIGTPLDLRTGVGAVRVVDKGVEVDLTTRITRRGEPVWVSDVTYLFRGRYREAARSPRCCPPVSGEARGGELPDKAVLEAAPVVARFRAPAGGVFSFGRLTGDYNGVHCFDAYARGFGFPRAFLHPQRAAGACLARLAGPRAQAQTLDLWIRGPVPYGAGVVLRAFDERGATVFGLSLEGDARAALVGRWGSA